MKTTLLTHALSMLMLLLPAPASAKDKVYLRDMRLTPNIGEGIVVANLDMTSSKKKASKQTPVTFEVNGTTTISKPLGENSHTVHVNNMMRWSVTHPAKYTITISRGSEAVSRSFGIREMEAVRGCLQMNDTTFMLKGLAENALPLQRQMGEGEWTEYFRKLKAEGFNLVSVSSERLTPEMLNASDKCGIIVHTTVRKPMQDESQATGKKPRKKAKKAKGKGDKLPPAPPAWGEHPSICLATLEQGATADTTGQYLDTHVFDVEKADQSRYIEDYRLMVDTTRLCLADMSHLQGDDSLQVVLERVLCTEGVGGILFASREQGNAMKPLMLMGKANCGNYDSSMSMRMDLHVANNTTSHMAGHSLVWTFEDDNGFVFSEGKAGGLTFHPLGTRKATTAFSPMANVLPGTHVRLNVWMKDSDVKRTWRFKIGYPPRIRFMNEHVQNRLREWSKRRPNETDEEYDKRVTPVTASSLRRHFATEGITRMAIGDNKVGRYRLSSFKSSDGTATLRMEKNDKTFKLRRMPMEMHALLTGNGECELRNVMVVPTNKDELEIVYAEYTNPDTGEETVFDGRDDEKLESLLIYDRYVPEELKELSEREDSILNEIKQKVLEDARARNLITDKTQMSVSAKVVTDYDWEGNTLNNYQITFEYHVDDRYSYQEDYGLGLYHLEESHAALSMLTMIAQSFESEFSRYIVPGKKLDIVITGSADASPINGTIKYDGCYGYFDRHPYYLAEKEDHVTITQEGGVTTNQQLAFLRAQGVGDFLKRNLNLAGKMDVRHFYNIELPKGRGGKYRRIKVCMNLIDVFE